MMRKLARRGTPWGQCILTAAFAALAILVLPQPARPAAVADAALVVAARKEGAVVWYSGMIVNQIVRPMATAFEKAYPGIKVQAARLPSAEAALKILDEARSGRPQADIFDGSATVFPLLAAGLVEPFRPASAEAFPPERRDPNGYWTSINLYFMVPAINTDTVRPADAPKTYQDLLDPKWRGKMAWTNDPTLLGPPGFIGNILMTMGDDAGMEYLRRLAKQQVVNVPGAQRVVLDQVIGGQYPLGLMTFNNHSVISAAQGAPVQWLPVSPVIEAPNPVGLVRNAPHPNAAKLLIDFILSDQGQAVLRDANYIPANPRVPPKDPALTPEGGHFTVTLMTPEITATKLAGWTKIYDQMFK